MEFRVDYLAIFQRNDSYCASESSFLNLLKGDDAITFASGVVTHKARTQCHLSVSFGKVAGREQRYCRLEFRWGDNSGDLGGFLSILSAARNVVIKAQGEIEILRDDISSHYSQKAYPLIQEIEILMRRLIATFMLVNLGKDWVSVAVPATVREENRRNKRKSNDDQQDNEEEAVQESSENSKYVNILRTYDFKHLGNILFDEYPTKTSQELYQQLRNATSIDDLETLKQLVPMSNWKRYFASIVKYEADSLKKKWMRLYAIRCIVAHNGPMTDRLYSEVESLVSQIRPTLIDAITRLDEIAVPPADVALVKQSIAGSASTSINEFLVTLQQLEETMHRRIISASGHDHVPFPAPSELFEMGLLDKHHFNEYYELLQLRDEVVDGANNMVRENAVRRAVARCRDVIEFVEMNQWFFDFKQMSELEQHSVVDELLSERRYDLLDDDEIGEAMSETDASNVDIETTIVDIDIRDDECVVELSYVATGEHNEGIDFGNRITGTATAVINWDGDLSFGQVTAEFDRGALDEEDEEDCDCDYSEEEFEDRPDLPKF